MKLLLYGGLLKLPKLNSTAISELFESMEYLRFATCLSTGASFQNSGMSLLRMLEYRTPPETFFEPGYSPRSKTMTFSPAFDRVWAQAMPEGPAPMIMQSNLSAINLVL